MKFQCSIQVWIGHTCISLFGVMICPFFVWRYHSFSAHCRWQAICWFLLQSCRCSDATWMSCNDEIQGSRRGRQSCSCKRYNANILSVWAAHFIYRTGKWMVIPQWVLTSCCFHTDTGVVAANKANSKALETATQGCQRHTHTRPAEVAHPSPMDRHTWNGE